MQRRDVFGDFRNPQESRTGLYRQPFERALLLKFMGDDTLTESEWRHAVDRYLVDAWDYTEIARELIAWRLS